MEGSPFSSLKRLPFDFAQSEVWILGLAVFEQKSGWTPRYV